MENRKCRSPELGGCWGQKGQHDQSLVTEGQTPQCVCVCGGGTHCVAMVMVVKSLDMIVMTWKFRLKCKWFLPSAGRSH